MRAVAILGLLLPAVAVAQPAIDSVDGIAREGETLRIFGSGFGMRAATPIAWDEFETGATGDPPGAPWVTESSTPEGAPAIDPGLPRRGSTRSLLCSFSETNEESSFGLDRALDEVFVSFWRQIRITGSFAQSWTAMRIAGTSATGHPAWRHVLQGGDGLDGAWAAGATDAVACDVDPAAMAGVGDGVAQLARWIREDYWLRASSPGAVDGWMQIWRDHYLETYTAWSPEAGAVVTVGPEVATRCGADTWSSMRLGATWSAAAGSQAVLWYDDIYVDETPARVELGNAPTWAAVTTSEIQPSTSWDSGEIEVTFNEGSFYTGYDYWLYVFDGDNVPSEGFVVRVGEVQGGGDDAGVPDASVQPRRVTSGCGCRAAEAPFLAGAVACLGALFWARWRNEKANRLLHWNARNPRRRGELSRGVQSGR